MTITIDFPDDKRIVVQTTGGRIYETFYDPWTGDWLVTSKEDELVQDDWMYSKDDALKYILYRCAALKEPEYTRAPERC